MAFFETEMKDSEANARQNNGKNLCNRPDEITATKISLGRQTHADGLLYVASWVLGVLGPAALIWLIG